MRPRFFTITHDISGVRIHDSERSNAPFSRSDTVFFSNIADLGFAYAASVVAIDERQSQLDAIAKLVQISSSGETAEMSALKAEIQGIIAR